MAANVQSLAIDGGVTKTKKTRRMILLLVAMPVNLLLVLVLFNMFNVPKLLGFETNWIKGYNFRDLDLIVIGCSLIIDSLVLLYTFKLDASSVYGFVSLVCVTVLSAKIFLQNEKNIFYLLGIIIIPLLLGIYYYASELSAKKAIKNSDGVDGDEGDEDDVS